MVPTRMAMTFCCLSVVTMIGALSLLMYSAMLPVMNGVWLWKSDWHSTRKSVKSLPLVHSRSLRKCALLRKLADPAGERGRAGIQVVVIVPAATFSRLHWLTAIAPNWVPALGQLLWLRIDCRDLAQQDVVVRGRAGIR